MCNPVALAIVGSTVASAAYGKHQNDKAMAQQRKQQEEAKKRAAAEKNAQRGNQLSEATPLLIKQGGNAEKGLSKLKVPGSRASGYSPLGMGGSSSTGLNIPNG